MYCKDKNTTQFCIFFSRVLNTFSFVFKMVNIPQRGFRSAHPSTHQSIHPSIHPSIQKRFPGTCSTEVSIAPWALSPSIPPSRSIDSKNEPFQRSPSFTTGLMIWLPQFWESSLPLNPTDEEMKVGVGEGEMRGEVRRGGGCNKRVKSGRPQRFALHPHFPNQPTPQHTFPTFFCM